MIEKHENTNEEGEYTSAAETLSSEDQSDTAQLASYLESEMLLSPQIHIVVRNKIAHIQGSVETREDRFRIEEFLARYTEIKSFECHLATLEE